MYIEVPVVYVRYITPFADQNIQLKVHVWAGISVQGRTGVCVFDGIMDAEMYVDILRCTLLPFLHDVFSDGHRFMQDNDPKYTSRQAAQFFQENRVNWWNTPPESPDLNPIENLWHEMKEFLRREVKPHTKDELIGGSISSGRL